MKPPRRSDKKRGRSLGRGRHHRGGGGRYPRRRSRSQIRQIRRRRRRRGFGKHPNATLRAESPDRGLSKKRTMPKKKPPRHTHLAMHRKVDSRVDLLHALTTRHARPMRRWQRARGHKVWRERERPEALEQPYDEEPSLIQREFLSQALQQIPSVSRTHETIVNEGWVDSRRADRRKTAST